MRIVIVLFFILIHLLCDGQKIKNDFAPPLDKMLLTGNFGEIRPGHFHAGFDLRTHAKENVPIKSIGDGYVSRVKVSAYGYGKIIYVTHANGYVSAYAHQHHFSDKIEKYVKKRQFEKECFEIELFPSKTELPVQKGEIIGYSGNSGSSEAPHLHFEIRDEKTEATINPQLFYTTSDSIRPEIMGIYFYDTDNLNNPKVVSSVVAENIKKAKSKGDSLYTFEDTLSLKQCFGIGVSVIDRDRPNGNSNQVYSVSVYLDNKLYYKHSYDTIPFEKTKYIYCFADQRKEYKKNKIQKCFLSKNEDLEIIKFSTNQGEIYLPDTLIHFLKIVAEDINGNSCSFIHKVKRSSECRSSEFKYGKQNCLNAYERKYASYFISLEPRTFFNDFDFGSYIKKKQGNYSDIVHIFGTASYVLKPFEFGIKVSKGVPDTLLKKMCIQEINSGHFYFPTWKDSMLVASIRSIGDYTCKPDTIAPDIWMSSKFKKNATLTNYSSIEFHAEDHQSGLDYFKLYINNKWVYAEHDHKKHIITYIPDKKLEKGKLNFELVVWDKCGNSKSHELELNN